MEAADTPTAGNDLTLERAEGGDCWIAGAAQTRLPAEAVGGACNEAQITRCSAKHWSYAGTAGNQTEYRPQQNART